MVWQGIASGISQGVSGQATSFMQGYYGRKAAERGIEAERQRQRLEIANLGDLFGELDTVTKQYEPYAGAGQELLPQIISQLQEGFQFDPAADPAYQANIRAQEQAISRASAATGGFFSGQRGVDLATVMSDLASREYASQYGRYRNRLQDLSQMMGFGYSAMGDLQQARAGYLGDIRESRRTLAGAIAGEAEGKATRDIVTGRAHAGGVRSANEGFQTTMSSMGGGGGGGMDMSSIFSMFGGG